MAVMGSGSSPEKGDDDAHTGPQDEGSMYLSDRSVGLLAVAAAFAVANAYYIQPLLVEVARALSLPGGLVGVLPALSQIGMACGLAFLLPLADVLSARKLLLIVVPPQIAALVFFAASGSALAVAAARF